MRSSPKGTETRKNLKATRSVSERLSSVLSGIVVVVFVLVAVGLVGNESQSRAKSLPVMPRALKSRRPHAVSLGLPGTPSIAWLSSTQTPPFSLSWNLWWGVPGKKWKLIDNGEVVYKSTSFTENTEHTQAGVNNAVNSAPGMHTYRVALCNEWGCSYSSPVTIKVLAPPGDSTYYLDASTYLKTGRVDIGQALIANVWNEGPLSVQIPNERKSWAMALAHASQIFRNVTGVDDVYVQGNHYLATAVQESRLGADRDAMSFTFLYAVASPAYRIAYEPLSNIDGFFQIEGSGDQTSAFADLIRLFPIRYGSQRHDTTVSGNRFATAAITASYYNLYMWYFLVGSGYRPIDFLKNAKDSQALSKIMALAYNRGLYSNYVSDVFTTKRAKCLELTDIADKSGACLPNINDYGSLYVRQVPGFNRGLMLAVSNQTNDVADEYGHTLEAYGAFEARLSWSDIDAYINAIAQLYSASDIVKARTNAASVFAGSAISGTISFRMQFGLVLDAIMLALPVDSPAAQLCSIYARCETEIWR
jgi:hypothetical protein